ncbi:MULTISPECIES: hypothetical protein [Oligella]|uniref:GTPase n=1 Tax=Oligella urethralis DNF00040 TaxID=1401065 RepID=A0A096ALC4_9BURK|nr:MULTISPECIES: hypothetical protein [Oligella]KGF31482.1 hypothetical protein HMPREF2130_03010 [Oligella urethralis DNF00040]OFS89483.1 hypothetical protein HMPREF3144_00460 [Oligella sp. HMSC05A10]SUA64545.1 Uncharacterized protein/domain associated with GTPases [Oligella urethralis]
MSKFTKLVQSTVARSRQSTPLDKEKLSIEELQLLRIRDECYEMVNTSSFFSGAVAAVPIPGMDIATDVSILMKLLPKINKKFGLSAEQVEALDPQLKQITLIAITKIGTSLIGKYITREAVVKSVTTAGAKIAATSTAKTGFKFVPFLGPVLSGGISYAAMRIVGRAHVNDCYQVALEVLQQKQKLANLDTTK